MSEEISTAVSVLDGSATWEAFGSEQAKAVTETIPDYMLAKGFDPSAIQALAKLNILGVSIDTFLLGNELDNTKHDPPGRYDARRHYLNIMVADALARRSGTDGGTFKQYSAYTGKPSDDASIIAGFTAASEKHVEEFPGHERQRSYRRNGASRKMIHPYDVSLDELVGEGKKAEELHIVPIAIVGAGASGVLAAATLSAMGFRNITLFDKRGETNGLWRQDNVRDGSKNNPFEIRFMGVDTPAASDVPVEGSGRQIEAFIDQVNSTHVDNSVQLREAVVQEIKPGNLNHAITYKDKTNNETRTENFPIVIYAPGIGVPLDPNDRARMTTPMERSELGERWQRQFSQGDLQKLGERVVLIGLGNSTAEIVYQLQKKAPNIDYRILTNSSFQSAHNPAVRAPGSRAPIYRDLTKPELGKLAGDLPHIDAMYQQAFREGKVLTDVREWSHEGGLMRAVDGSGIETRIPFSKLFTLIGYGQKHEVNHAMGLHTVDPRTGSIDYDFDGEVRRPYHDDSYSPQRHRVYPGYFALGPILKNNYNPNALVIPGIQYQLQQLAGTLLVRAAEVVYSRQGQTARKHIAQRREAAADRT